MNNELLTYTLRIADNSLILGQRMSEWCSKGISKKLMGYAMTLSDNNLDDALDLIQSTMVKLIKNQDKLMDSDQPMAYAKKILLNDFRDGYRKKQKMPLAGQNP